MKRLIAILIVTMPRLVAAEPATQPSYRRYETPGPAKLWSIEVPSDWKASDRFARRGILQFQSPDVPSVTLTVSSVAGLVLPEKPESSMLDIAFPDAEPMTDPMPMRGDGWIGLFRTYQHKQAVGRNHVGLVAMRDDTVVLVTVTADQRMTGPQTQAVAAIISRLRLGAEPPTATQPAP
jgi:hypothetical protein